MWSRSCNRIWNQSYVQKSPVILITRSLHLTWSKINFASQRNRIWPKKSPLSFCRKNEKQIFLRLNWNSFSRNKSTTAHTKEKISNCKKQISPKIFRFQLYLSLILECQTDIRKNFLMLPKEKIPNLLKAFFKVENAFLFLNFNAFSV